MLLNCVLQLESEIVSISKLQWTSLKEVIEAEEMEAPSLTSSMFGVEKLPGDCLAAVVDAGAPVEPLN